MEPIRMVRGSIIAVPGIDALLPVMIAEKHRIPMVVTPRLRNTPTIAILSISTVHTAPPVAAMLVPLLMGTTPIPMALGPTILLLSTAEQKAVPCVITAPMNMQAIHCRMVPGLLSVTASTVEL